MNYKKCKKILSLDFENINNIEKLQEYRINLLDSYRYLNEFSELGLTIESLKRGFIVQVPELSFDSFIPKDKFMSDNINITIKIIDEKLELLYKIENINEETEEDER